jgi:predicted  nucleic acid-binding Zn-ribbon protein
MKDLQEELKTQQDASAALKVEIEAIKNDYKKIRKDVKAEFAERQDTLPCAIYKVRLHSIICYTTILK